LARAGKGIMSRMTSLSARAAGLALLAAVAGCSPIQTYRELSGVAKYDPDPVTSPFVHNMAAAYAEPYPNLASVPPPPSRETTAAERRKLAESLVADREKAAASAAPAAAAAAGSTSPVGEAPTGGIIASGPAATRGAGAHPAGAAARSGPVAPPQDSTLRMPQIASLPQPETARPAPPPPQLPAAPPPSAAPVPAAAIATATPAPPPPMPVLAPIAPPPPPPSLATARPTSKTADKAPALTVVARLHLAPDAALPDAAERAQIDKTAALYRQKPGPVRVVAYAAAPSPGSDPLGLYQAALDRARGVAKALAAAGIPADKISAEAKPAERGSANAVGQVEIELAR
jgi:hypothetical protein